MNATTTLRTRWHCWIVAHGGEGPGRLEMRDVIKRSLEDQPQPIDAETAAELYAERDFNSDEPFAIWHGDSIIVGVAAERGGEAVGAYRCTLRIELNADVDVADWIPAEALVP